MANFPTHIGVGTLTSGALATLTLAADVVAPENLVAIAAAGVLGSVLPDIDLKDSRPSKALFSGLAAFFSFAALFLLAGKLSVAELWIVAALTFIGIRYVAHAIFHRMSYHRGIYHSILAGVFFAFFTAAIYKWLLGRHEGVAWLAAAFMFVGYMTHLILDEIYTFGGLKGLLTLAGSGYVSGKELESQLKSEVTGLYLKKGPALLAPKLARNVADGIAALRSAVGYPEPPNTEP